MITGWTDEVGRVPERKRLSAFASLLLIGGLSLALWWAIVSVIVHVP